jgi:hypothetical protein
VSLDIHQHLWTEPLLDALERRRRLPFLRRRGRQLTLYLGGEAPSMIEPAGQHLEARLALLEQDGVDRAVIALSSPLGIEALPREEALGLIDAHLSGVADFGGPFESWGPLPLDGLGAGDVDAVAARGCIGISLPAGAVAPPYAVHRLSAALRRAEDLDLPLFIHPGPGLSERVPPVGLDDPLWWPAMTVYVAQMQAAWLTFQTRIRRAHPRLRVVFAMLAGCAPLQSERLAARGGPRLDGPDPLSYYETSSYGPHAIDAMAHRVGLERLLYGSDRPVVEPSEELDRTFRGLFLDGNAAWLTCRSGVAA